MKSLYCAFFHFIINYHFWINVLLSNLNTLSHFLASSILCVTNKIAISFSTNFVKIFKISCSVSSSKAPVGSSANIISGSLINALAIATRCASPPERTLGNLLRNSFISNLSAISIHFFVIISFFSFLQSSGNDIL